MPTPPKLVDAAKYSRWNTYVTEATANIEPYVQPLPPDPDDPDAPAEVEVPCPIGTQMQALTAAQRQGDDAAAFVALFGKDVAPRLLVATADAPFLVRARLISDVMRHYALQAAAGPSGD